MGLDQDLQEIQATGQKAWQDVMDGEFSKARNKIKRLKRSPYVSESTRIVAIVEGKILERQGDQKGAAECIRQNICYLWGVPEALEILSSGHPCSDGSSKHFEVKLLGGLATLGMFTQFTNEHISHFHVIANSQEEAIAYIDEMLFFADKASRKVVLFRQLPDAPLSPGLARGVTAAFPFTLDRGDSQESLLTANH